MSSNYALGVPGKTEASKFPNPFCDIASEYVPSDLHEIFELCEYMYMATGIFRSVHRRVVRYFITELSVDGRDTDESEDLKNLLTDKLHILSEISDAGEEFGVYGNVFVSIYFPFDRYLRCPDCSTEIRSSEFSYKYEMRSGKFKARCPRCADTKSMEAVDRRSLDRDRISFIRWNPKEIRLRVHPVSGRTEYYWEIPKQFRDKIASGDRFAIEDTPKSMLECMRGGDNRYYKFKPDAIKHVRESHLSGVPLMGWGLPPILPNFKLAYYIQILRRYDEALAFDYIIPFRILHPGVGPGNMQDAVMSMDLGKMKSELQHIVDRRRKDPTAVHIAPFEIGYEMVGGEGKALAPKENILEGVKELLNNLNYPYELYTGSLNITAAPVALRLMEKTWSNLVDGYKGILQWSADKLCRHFMWDRMAVGMQPVTIADDLERKALALQAAAAADISKSTAYKPFNIDYIDEQQRVIDEQKKLNDMQQKAVEEMNAGQAQLAGGAPPQTAGGPGGQVGATPGDLHEQARQTAEQLLFNTPETLRRGELQKIKNSNETLHALVIQKMDEIRHQASRQGRAMVMQQARDQGGMA